MWFRKKETLQRLNLEPKMAAAPSPDVREPHSAPPPPLQSAIREDLSRIAKQVRDSGRIPDCLFICQVANGGLLVIVDASTQNKVVLLFSNPFSASDHLRARGTAGTVGQFKVDALPELAQRWRESGIQSAVVDCCPRCPKFRWFGLENIAKWTREDFANFWVQHRASLLLQAGLRIQSSMKHSAAGSLAAARSDLEYVRDHIDCGVPYLHQMIGIIAGMQQDQAALAASMERLKEFGAEFEAPLVLTPESGRLLATASVGMMTYFGMLPPGNAASNSGTR